MIKLKNLLMEKDGTVWIGNESYPAHTRTALHWMRQKYIPLSPKVVEKIVGKKISILISKFLTRFFLILSRGFLITYHFFSFALQFESN